MMDRTSCFLVLDEEEPLSYFSGVPCGQTQGRRDVKGAQSRRGRSDCTPPSFNGACASQFGGSVHQ